ncbi:MAG: hypothetical protein SGBAC_005977 [Bacillariaceae sp.]
MGIMEEESKHEAVNTSQKQPLTQQQVLQHLSTLQKRMGQMQSFAKGLSDQTQQDKLKIQTLEQQLEASKTLQWAKQRTSPRAERKQHVSEIPENARAILPPISTPRLESIRKARQEREEKLRVQFSQSSDVNDLAKAEHEHNHELEEKLQDLEEKYENLQSTLNDVQAENSNLYMEHTETLAEKQAVISNLEGEMKALEELIEESYNDRENLEEKLIKVANKNNALDIQLEQMEEISFELRERGNDMALQILQAHDTKSELLSDRVNDSLEALVGQEEQNQMIQQLESIVETLEHRVEKASQSQPEEHSSNTMQRESDWGKDVLALHHKVETLKKELKDQETNFHKDTVEMEVELMDAQEFVQMQRNMMDAQETELLLLSNALADLQQYPPLARSLSGGNLFAIHEEESEVAKSCEEYEDQQSPTPPPPPPPPLLNESPLIQQQSKEAESFKKGQEEKALQERVKKAHLQALHCNIYVLSRKFEWQLQRREELEVQMEDLNKKFGVLALKYTKKEEELKKLKPSQESLSTVSEGNEDDPEASENKESLTRALMRASMSIRGLQQELKTTKQRTTELESELQTMAPAVEEKDDKQPDSVADLKSQLDEQTETNDLLKEFMEDMKDTHEKERAEWKAQQEELKRKIEQLQRTSGGTDHATTPAKSTQDSTLIIASPPKSPLRKEWMTEISVVRSEISRLKRTLQSKQPQNESFLGAMNESGSQQSDDYIFADRSDDDINMIKGSGSGNESEKWHREVTALREELSDLTMELRTSHHHENKVTTTSPGANWKNIPPNPVRTGLGLDDTSSVDSSTTGGFENEILLLREEVDRQNEERKTGASPYSAVSSAGTTSPNGRSSLVSSLEDSSFSEYNAFSEI